MLKKLNKKILYTSLLLVLTGFLIFFSVVLKNLHNLDFFISILTNQVIAIFLGLIIMFVIATNKIISRNFFRHNSHYILLLAIALQLLVLIPGVGISYQGSLR